jgi:hypothetical protein
LFRFPSSIPSLDVGWVLASMLICSDFQFEAEVLGSNFDFIQKKAPDYKLQLPNQPYFCMQSFTQMHKRKIIKEHPLGKKVTI